MRIETPLERLQGVVSEIQNVVKDVLSWYSVGCSSFVDHQLTPVCVHHPRSPHIGRYLIPNKYDLIGDITICTPDACKVELVIDGYTCWSGKTEPGKEFRFPFTLNRKRLADRCVEVLVHNKFPKQVSATGRIFLDHEEKEMYLSYIPRGYPWYTAKMPREWS